VDLDRSSGVLLHPTSFPSTFGIGDLGAEAYDFIDFLAAGAQKYWQILPLNPPGIGESPYAAYSAFAQNPLLISLDGLLEDGLLTQKELRFIPQFPADTIAFSNVIEYKCILYEKAYARFKAGAYSPEYTAYMQKNLFWLHEYAFYMALRRHFGERAWTEWEKGLIYREPQSLAYYENLLQDRLEFHYFLQYIFYRQWRKLKKYAGGQDIRIIGDLPIFVAQDSADTWVHPQLFALDEALNVTGMAGVPPDYFSETGQLWGNPLYRWGRMAADGYGWWRRRLEVLLELVDLIRLDHFRGFEAYWEIPGNEVTAVRGRWVKGPGQAFFAALEEQLGSLPIVAEDLGYITPEVRQLKEDCGFPGMKVLQFTFAEDIRERVCAQNTVYYTGTHDNNTLLGWYKETVLEGLARRQEILDEEKVCWDFIKTVSKSGCALTIFPLQDLLGLNSWARMNTPGTTGGSNWRWRYKKGVLTPALARRLAQLTKESGR
jgi:4-alpha-glucanotransferase